MAMTTRILVGGLDGSGKSTIACSLAEALRHDGVAVHCIEIDPWSDTHDIILGKKDPSLRNPRHQVAIEDFRERVEMFRHSPYPIVIGDLQGRHQYIWNHLLRGIADHGILVGREPTEKDAKKQAEGILQTIPEWEDLFRGLDTPLSHYIHTLLPGQTQTVEGERAGFERTTVVPALTDRRLYTHSPHIVQLKLHNVRAVGVEPSVG
jgi:hypothetical protein